MDMSGFIAGCIGGGTGIAVGHPMDTIKVRLQTQHMNTGALKYKGLIHCFAQILKHEGVYGLYKGLTPPLIGVSAQNALMFGIQHGILTYFDSTTLRSEFYAGCFTGAIQTVLSSPMELSKIQLQMQGIGAKLSHGEKKFKGPVDVLKQFYKTQGIRGCLRGFWITFVRDCPGFGVYFYSYAYFCELVTPKHKTVETLGIWGLLLAGGLCGIVSWAIIYPIDVLKSRIQVEGFQPHGKYRNHFHCIASCYRNEGLGCFTKGLGTTVVRAFPVNAATLCTVTLVIRVLNRNKIPSDSIT